MSAREIVHLFHLLFFQDCCLTASLLPDSRDVILFLSAAERVAFLYDTQKELNSLCQWLFLFLVFRTLFFL